MLKIVNKLLNSVNKNRNVDKEIGKAIMICHCTRNIVEWYFRIRGYHISHLDRKNIRYHLEEYYKEKNYSKYIRNIALSFDSLNEVLTIYIDFNSGYYKRELKLTYDVNEIKIDHEENFKELDIIIKEYNGKLRYTGNLNCVIKNVAAIEGQFEFYNNKYESDFYNTKVYYQGSMKNGLPHGGGKLLWEDNTLLYEGEFKKGEVTGYGRVYFKTGRISEEGYRENGKLNNKVVTYYEDGQICYKGNMRDGIPHGYGISYYEDGSLEYNGEWDEAYPIDGRIFRSEDGTRSRYIDDKLYIVDYVGNTIRLAKEGE